MSGEAGVWPAVGPQHSEPREILGRHRDHEQRHADTHHGLAKSGVVQTGCTKSNRIASACTWPCIRATTKPTTSVSGTA